MSGLLAAKTTVCTCIAINVMDKTIFPVFSKRMPDFTDILLMISQCNVLHYLLTRIYGILARYL